MKTPPMKGENSPVSPQQVDSVIGDILRSRAPKEVARAADVPLETARSWRKLALPRALAALVNLIRHDDEVFAAVLKMAGRGPIAALGIRERQAIAEALRVLEGRP